MLRALERELHETIATYDSPLVCRTVAGHAPDSTRWDAGTFDFEYQYRYGYSGLFSRRPELREPLLGLQGLAA